MAKKTTPAPEPAKEAPRRWDLCVPIPKKDGGTFWHKVGMAMLNDRDQLRLYFNSIPPPPREEGGAWVIGFPPRPDDQQQSRQQPTTRHQRSLKDDLDDEIPF